MPFALLVRLADSSASLGCQVREGTHQQESDRPQSPAVHLRAPFQLHLHDFERRQRAPGRGPHGGIRWPRMERRGPPGSPETYTLIFDSPKGVGSLLTWNLATLGHCAQLLRKTQKPPADVGGTLWRVLDRVNQ